MATRTGGFSGTLDPFGRSRGGLGRYNMSGDSIQSLADYEAYATAVAWANGQASDEEYLASLQRQVDMANPGTRERVTAENKLGDARYTIGRNKIARDVNGAATPTQRTAALRALMAYDEARLATMSQDNEAYRSQVDRVAGGRVDIRQSQYSEMVNKVNAGKASTTQLLALVKGFRDASSGDPDADTWTQTVISLTDRVADEDLTDAYQAYQHDRLSGAKLLGKIDARMRTMVEGSPGWKELNRQREDLVQRISDQDRAERAATMNGKRSAGKVSDSQYMGYLRDDLAREVPGTSGWIQARDRLAEYTWSVSEDKLRFDVTKGRKPVSALISFYKAARAGMDPNSERYRALTLTIDSLSRGGGSGGGSGGGGGGKAGKGLAYYTKVLGGQSALHDIIGDAKQPPDFADLFRLDISSPTSRAWWDNNLRSAAAAFRRGDRTWTYYDKRGNAHDLPFTPDMMSQFDAMNYTYARNGLAQADDAKDAQYWTGKVITATNSIKQRGGQYTMDIYIKTFGDLERAKASALAGDRWAEYINLTREQTELARFILGGTLDPENSTNPYLTADQKARIGRDLATIAPRNNDPTSPGWNPTGDLVLQMVNEGGVSVQVDADGAVVAAQLDPNAGYRTQLPDGTVALVRVDMSQPDQVVYDPALDRMVPAYLTQTVATIVRVGGQDIEVHQPTAGTASLPVFVAKTGAPSVPGGRQPYGYLATGQIPGTGMSIDPYVVGGAVQTLPVKSFTTREGNTVVTWASLDGISWIRYNAAEGDAPRIIIGSDYVFDGKAWMKDGKAVTPTDVLGSAHWWGPGDNDKGQGWGIGAPGRNFTIRTVDDEGFIDTRPAWMFPTKGVIDEAPAYQSDRDETRAVLRPSKPYVEPAPSYAGDRGGGAGREVIASSTPSYAGDRGGGAGRGVVSGDEPSALPPSYAGDRQAGREVLTGEVIPLAARPKATLAPTPLLGVKAKPTPNVRPAALAPGLSPVATKPIVGGKLAPIAKPKLPPKRPKPKPKPKPVVTATTPDTFDRRQVGYVDTTKSYDQQVEDDREAARGALGR